MAHNSFSNIPVNIISGFLGVGKTTAIKSLLKQKPKNERWAVIVNEFGQVGIDGDFLENKQVDIKQISGGCLCCVSSQSFNVGLNEIIRRINPHRILIEPTGLGHPKKLLENLSGEFYKNVLKINAVICLIDARQLNDSRYTENQTYMDQINLSDILMANKIDTYSDEDKKLLFQFLSTHHLTHKKILEVEQGDFILDVLDDEHQATASLSQVNHHENHSHVVNDVITENNDWEMHVSETDDFMSIGWVISARYVFSNSQVMAWLFSLNKKEGIERIKGVLNTDTGWVSVNYSNNEKLTLKIGERLSSKLEIITSLKIDHSEMNSTIQKCVNTR